MVAGAQQQPQTTGAAAQPAQPSPMEPSQQFEFPPSPIQPRPDEAKAEEPPPPPEATKAPPRQEPYIPSDRRTQPHEWGRPDLAIQGAGKYPGLIPGPYMPQPHEWRGLVRNSTSFLGRFGSGVVSPLAVSLAQLDPAYWKARQAGETHKAQMAQAQFNLQAKELAQKLAAENRAYGDAFAAYGPHRDASGKLVPGDEDALREEIMQIAAASHDPFIQSVMDKGGLPAVERVIAARHANGQDLTKVLTQQIKQAQLDGILQRNAKAKREARAAESQLEGYGAAGKAPAPAAGPDIALPPQPEAEPGEKQREWPAEPAPPATKEAPETSEGAPEDTGDQAAAEPAETPAQTAEAETPAAPEQTAETKSPSEQVLAAAEDTGAAPAAGATPTRLAEAATGRATDAPSPAARAQAPAPEPQLPEWLRSAQEGTRPATRAAAPATTGAAAAPAAAPAEPERLPESEFAPPRSPALDKARNFVNPYTSQPFPLDPEGVNARARGLVNGTIKTIQGQKEVPQEIRNIDRMRANEMEATLDRIIADPKYKGDDVYKAISKVANNPELAADLRAYVDGDVAVPSGSWNNLNFLKRVIALGHKVDPDFNTATFAVRARTKQSFANGADARNFTSLGTLYLHADEGIKILRDIVRQNPGILKEYLGASKLGTRLGRFGPTPEQQALFARLDVVLGTVATEYVRATSGAAPTVSHRNEVHHGLDYKWNEESTVIDQLQQMKTLAQDRMKGLGQRYNAVLGVGAKKDPMANLINNYIAGTGPGQSDNDTKSNVSVSGGYVRAAGDDLGPYANRNDPRVRAAIQQALTPLAPRDQEAVDWARQNPQDPRARQILEHNNAL
jgi:hypothetical protein